MVQPIGFHSKAAPVLVLPRTQGLVLLPAAFLSMAVCVGQNFSQVSTPSLALSYTLPEEMWRWPEDERAESPPSSNPLIWIAHNKKSWEPLFYTKLKTYAYVIYMKIYPDDEILHTHIYTHAYILESSFNCFQKRKNHLKRFANNSKKDMKLLTWSSSSSSSSSAKRCLPTS